MTSAEQIEGWMITSAAAAIAILFSLGVLL